MAAPRPHHQEGARWITAGVLELRATADASSPGGGRTIHGVAVPWGERMRVGNLEESFRRGSFARSLGMIRSRSGGASERDRALVPYLPHHEAQPIAAAEAWESDVGLMYEAAILPVPAGEDHLALVRAGAITGASIEFRPVRDSPADLAHDWGRHVERLEAQLFAIAGAYAPAYDGARIVGLRALHPSATPVRDRYDVWHSRTVTATR